MRKNGDVLLSVSEQERFRTCGCGGALLLSVKKQKVTKEFFCAAQGETFALLQFLFAAYFCESE